MHETAGRRGVSIIVVTYNSAAHLPELIASIRTALAPWAEWEIIAVDNDSSDGSATLMRELAPEARVLSMGRNAGYAAAINAGAERARPDFDLLVLNPDVRLEPGCVMELQDALRRTGAGIAVPRLVDEHGNTWPSMRRDPGVIRALADSLLGGRRAARLGLSETVHVDATYDQEQVVQWATGAVLLVSSQCRADVGTWDESYFLYSEEVDYFQRARDAGYTAVYTPQALAFHAQGAYQTDPGLWQLLMANRALYFRRRSGPVRSVAFQLALAIGELARLPRNPVHRAGLHGVLAARVFAGRVPRPANDGIVWFAAQDWWYHNRAHSDFQLMQYAARDRPVLVVNSLGLRLPRKRVSSAPWRRIMRKVASTARLLRRPDPDNPNFYILSPVFLPAYGATRTARFSAWMVRQQVRLAGRVIGVGRSPAVVVTIPTAWPVAERLPHSTLVFNRADRHSEFPEADAGTIRALEDQLLAHSDVVLYVSHELMRLDADKVGDRAYFLDHGVEIEHFTQNDSQVPTDIANIPRPRVGFFGGLDDFVVDVDLFRETALSLPDINLVLIGDASCDMSELVELPNVHWLGFRPYSTIPAYGRAFDIALMPWLDNEWIRFANPIKLKEYFALGLTVVTTDYPEVENYRDRLHVAMRRQDFPGMVKRALEDRFDPEVLRTSVLTSSWAAKTHELLGVIDTSAQRVAPQR